MFPIYLPEFRAQNPDRSGLPSGVRGAGAVRIGLPSAVRGIPGVGLSHWAATGQPTNQHITIAASGAVVFITILPDMRAYQTFKPVAAWAEFGGRALGRK